MAVASAQVALSSTPTDLSLDGAHYAGGHTMAITKCSIDIYLGPDNTVSLGSGALLPAGTPFSADLRDGEHLWAIAATGTGTAYILRTGM